MQSIYLLVESMWFGFRSFPMPVGVEIFKAVVKRIIVKVTYYHKVMFLPIVVNKLIILDGKVVCHLPACFFGNFAANS